MLIARQSLDNHLSKTSIPRISKRQGATRFEFLIKTLFERMGFSNVSHLGGPGDKGVDLEAFNRGMKVLIQCKHQKNPITPGVVREFAHVIERDASITDGYLVTTSVFSPQSKIYATDNEICRKKMTLIDRRELMKLLRENGLSLENID